MKKLLTTKRVFYTIYSFLLLGIAVAAYANSNGMTGKTKRDGGEGCFCHGASPSPNVNVLINGPDTVDAGATADFTVTMTGGPLVRGGTNIAALNGDLNITDGSLQKIGDELTHTSPKAPLSNTVTFNFSYTAPGTPGVDTLYANGNSVNFNGSSDGDEWNFADNKSIVVDNPTGITNSSSIAEHFHLSQNFPNPFNPTTIIAFSIPSQELTTLEVFNSSGKNIATLVNQTLSAGTYEFNWNATGLTSGVYFYTITAGNFKQTRRMVLLK